MLMTYQVNKGSPHQCCNELCSILIFLYKKINHTRHRPSLFAKRHARLACSLASVLTDGSLPLPPFGDYACVANISMVRLSHRRNGPRSIPIFLCRKISHMLRHSSSFAKRHTRFACSLVNALTTTCCRYHLLAIIARFACLKPLILPHFYESSIRILAVFL